MSLYIDALKIYFKKTFPDSYKAEINLKEPTKIWVKPIKIYLVFSFHLFKDHILYDYLVLDPNSLKITDVGRFSVGYF